MLLLPYGTKKKSFSPQYLHETLSLIMEHRPPPSLATLLYRELNTAEPTRLLDDYLHAGDLYDACMRQIYLAKKEGIALTRAVPPATRMLWEMGKAFELAIQARFAKMGVYAEVQPELKNEELKISGHPDGRMGNGFLNEIKSTNAHFFRLVARKPLPHHEFQLQTYLWLDKTQSGLLFYATWDTVKVPFHQHIVHYNLRVGETITRAVGTLRNAESGGEIPSRICSDENDRRALLCPLRGRCFLLPSGPVVKTIGESLQ